MLSNQHKRLSDLQPGDRFIHLGDKQRYTLLRSDIAYGKTRHYWCKADGCTGENRFHSKTFVIPC